MLAALEIATGKVVAHVRNRAHLGKLPSVHE
jgi:hypothetical protein